MRSGYVVFYGGRTTQSVRTYLGSPKTARSKALAFARAMAQHNEACVKEVSSRRAGSRIAACFLAGGRKSKTKRVPKAWKGIL